MNRWHFVCQLDDIFDGGGVCALVDGEQVALLRVGEEVFALDNRDPFSGANVIVARPHRRPGRPSWWWPRRSTSSTSTCAAAAAWKTSRSACAPGAAACCDGRVWVESAACSPAQGRGRRRLVVVGNGMAGDAHRRGAARAGCRMRFDITVFGAEPRGNYNRILLSPVLAGDAGRDEIMLHDIGWYRERGITLHTGDPVVEHRSPATARDVGRRRQRSVRSPVAGHRFGSGAPAGHRTRPAGRVHVPRSR